MSKRKYFWLPRSQYCKLTKMQGLKFPGIICSWKFLWSLGLLVWNRVGRCGACVQLLRELGQGSTKERRLTLNEKLQAMDSLYDAWLKRFLKEAI